MILVETSRHIPTILHKQYKIAKNAEDFPNNYAAILEVTENTQFERAGTNLLQKEIVCLRTTKE